jgi:aldose 1-epimerase
MSLHDFGKVNGQDVTEVRLANRDGMAASILTFGAAIRDLVVPSTTGHRHVVLGYQALDGYLSNPAYLGTTAGRYANRIAGGKFSLNGVDHEVSTNEKGKTHLHGGHQGISHRLWTIIEDGMDHVTMEYTAANGEEGFPGDVTIRCRYRLLPPATLAVEYSATTNQPTVVNIAHHSYFTLQENTDIREHEMQIAADLYTPVDADLIPTGEVLKVEGTPFDFRELRTLSKPPSGKPVPYDINFVLRGQGMRTVAQILSPDHKLAMEVVTTEPGLQVYDSNSLAATAPPLTGQEHAPYRGIALEPQRFPDSPNNPHFPSVVLKPGETYRQMTAYRFKAL